MARRFRHGNYDNMNGQVPPSEPAPPVLQPAQMPEQGGMNGPMGGNGLMGSMEPEPEDRLLDAMEEMQTAISQLNARMDKVENQPYEDKQQEVPAMESNGVPPQFRKDDEACASKEEVNVGGEDKPADFSDMDSSGKDKGQPQDPSNVMQEMLRTMQRMQRKMEELTGHPEVPRGKEEKPIGPDNTKGIPASKQPANGTAPSGGGFDSDDKINEQDANKAANLAPNPKKELPKQAFSKNQAAPGEPLEGSKMYTEEQEEEDPSEPQPGETQDKPDQMDMKNPAERLFKNLQNEIRAESLQHRQSIVFEGDRRDSMTPDEQSAARAREFMQSRQAANTLVREYLRRAGVSVR